MIIGSILIDYFFGYLEAYTLTIAVLMAVIVDTLVEQVDCLVNLV